MTRYRSYRDLDWVLLAITLAICAIGVLQIFSATHATKWHDAWWKQIVWVVVGTGLMWIVLSVDYHTLLGQVYLFYTVSIASLGLVLIVGRLVFGSRRWIRIFGASLQISEFVKLVIVLLVARYLSELRGDGIGPRDLLKLGGMW